MINLRNIYSMSLVSFETGNSEVTICEHEITFSVETNSWILVLAAGFSIFCIRSSSTMCYSLYSDIFLGSFHIRYIGKFKIYFSSDLFIEADQAKKLFLKLVWKVLMYLVLCEKSMFISSLYRGSPTKIVKSQFFCLQKVQIFLSSNSTWYKYKILHFYIQISFWIYTSCCDSINI